MKKTTYLSKKLNIQNTRRRYMLSRAYKAIAKNIDADYTRNYATKVSVRLCQKLANDGTGKHTHVAKQTCILIDCENKACPKLCDTPTEFEVLGHNTHKPPVGRVARFVADRDANGNAKIQYFVKTNKRQKMTEQEKQQEGKNIKPDLKQQIFVDQYQDKYE